MPLFPLIQPISERAVNVVFGQEIAPETNERARALADWLQRHPFPGFLCAVPAYTSVTVHFDPLALYQSGSPVRQVSDFLAKQLPLLPASNLSDAPWCEIPVRYEGPDLAYLSDRLQIPENEIIRLHLEPLYMVCMIGFLPGFPYLGPLPEALVLPRRATPRQRVPAGSVAIAGRQTGIYPQESPGGWHLIGHTDIRLFDARQPVPNRLQPGFQVKFVAS